MTLHELVLLIQDSAFSTALRESQYAFPLIEAAHLLGLALSFGLVLLTDLRLTGLLLRRVPLADLLQQLRPYIFGGFALTFITGGLLFWAEPETLYANLPFWLKVGCMVVACINALVFELRWGHRAAQWADAIPLPAAASRAGWISLIFWSLVTVFGRSIPYY
jgi:hypothetical protein